MESIGDCLANILLLQKKIAPVEQALPEPDPSPYCQMVSKVILVWIFEGNGRARITHLMEKLLQRKFEIEYKRKDEILQNLQVLESYLSQDVIQNYAALMIDEMDQQQQCLAGVEREMYQADNSRTYDFPPNYFEGWNLD